MTALAGKVRSFEAGGLTITIAGPIRGALNVLLTEPLENRHFSIDVALVEAPALPESSKPKASRAPPQPEPDAEADLYGENR